MNSLRIVKNNWKQKRVLFPLFGCISKSIFQVDYSCSPICIFIQYLYFTQVNIFRSLKTNLQMYFYTTDIFTSLKNSVVQFVFLSHNLYFTQVNIFRSLKTNLQMYFYTIDISQALKTRLEIGLLTFICSQAVLTLSSMDELVQIW